ncbi:MAG TPA: ABC transporter permease subunit [Patescibacteria group bacterium]|nr:ABC transporter permease subunit [Patescibacteria group bacterium]
MWRITLRELKDRKWSLLAYCLGSLLMLWIYVATFRSSQSSTKQLQDLVKNYPKGFLDAFGLNNLSLDTIEKYLNAKHFSLLWPLVAIILAISRAGSQIAGDIQNGTMGLLLSLPLKRLQIFASKYSAGIITIVAFTGISVFGVIPLAKAYNIPSHWHILLSAWVLTSLFMWSIYCIGLAISSWVSDKGKVYAIAGGIVLLSYVAYILSLISNNLNGLKYYSLFYYFNTLEVLSTGHIKLGSYLVFSLVIIAGTFLAAWHFNRRDISV